MGMSGGTGEGSPESPLELISNVFRGKYFARETRQGINYVFVRGETYISQDSVPLVAVDRYDSKYQRDINDMEVIETILTYYRAVTPEELSKLEKSQKTSKKHGPNLKSGTYKLRRTPESRAAIAEIGAEMDAMAEESARQIDKNRRAAARFVERAREARNKKPFYTTP